MSKQSPKNRPTVGKIATDLQQEKPETRDPIELEREIHKDYVENIASAIATGKKMFPQTDFFVVVETKKERLLENVIRNYFFSRMSCPTPNYDQTVYHYKYADNGIFFLWVIPSKDTCEIFLANREKIVPEEWALLKFVLDFEDGTLLKLAKCLNGEGNGNILIN